MQRDRHGIIIQSNEDPNYEDGGDSAFSTGLMAFSGSLEDVLLMPQFIIENKLVRHPYQPAWNRPNLTSRDQVVAFFAGLHSVYIHNLSLVQQQSVRSACIAYAKCGWVNKDILLPDVRLYLYKCAGINPPAITAIFGILFAALSLIWDCFIKPNHEMNQTVCRNIVFGKKWIQTLVRWHPDLNKNLVNYFCGFPFRDKAEIGLALERKISEAILPSAV
jgi:hypothetical protein